ncbi:hypothetical protein CSQ89_09395 [Chitinimonas sp. BJB300]|nr:hypothetical protein CSQ89_09395 [Chitinimonas sp. BJB300]
MAYRQDGEQVPKLTLTLVGQAFQCWNGQQSELSSVIQISRFTNNEKALDYKELCHQAKQSLRLEHSPVKMRALSGLSLGVCWRVLTYR